MTTLFVTSLAAIVGLPSMNELLDNDALKRSGMTFALQCTNLQSEWAWHITVLWHSPASWKVHHSFERQSLNKSLLLVRDYDCTFVFIWNMPGHHQSQSDNCIEFIFKRLEVASKIWRDAICAALRESCIRECSAYPISRPDCFAWLLWRVTKISRALPALLGNGFNRPWSRSCKSFCTGIRHIVYGFLQL